MDFNRLSPSITCIKPTVCGTKDYKEINDLCEFCVRDKLQGMVNASSSLPGAPCCSVSHVPCAVIRYLYKYVAEPKVSRRDGPSECLRSGIRS